MKNKEFDIIKKIINGNCTGLKFVQYYKRKFLDFDYPYIKHNFIFCTEDYGQMDIIMLDVRKKVKHIFMVKKSKHDKCLELVMIEKLL